MDIKRDGDLFHCKSRSNLYPYSISFSIEDITPLIDVYFSIFNHNTHIMWFKNEFKNTFNTDVRNLNITNQSKYWHIKELNLIIIKLEYLNQCIDEISHLIDNKIDNKTIVKANEGKNKNYSELYERFKKEVKYRKDFVERIYTNEYINKFYTSSEIENFKQNISIIE